MDDFNDLQMDDTPSPQPKPPPISGTFHVIFSQMTSDMKFVGMFTIIYGAINCLSIIGAVIGIPMIFIGLRMRDAADYFEAFKSTNDKNALRRGFEAQAKYFKISKIMIIISLVLAVLYIIGIILFFSYLFNTMSNLNYNSV